MPSQSSYSLWKKGGITITDHAQNEGSVLNDRISEIRIDDQESSIRDSDATSPNDQSLLEPSGRRAIKDEVSDLIDLLRRTSDYVPEKRMSADEAANPT